MYRIMIVEDDLVISKTVKEYLIKWDYEVEYITDFKNVTEQFASFEPHLILLDISLPYFNGYHWCTQIRKMSNVPIVFISSASDNMSMVMAMNMGGDDFIAKPFDLEVVVAKIQALLRRTYSFHAQTNLIEHGGGILNLSDTTFIYGEGKIELTKNEYKILQILMENAGSVVLREHIMEKLWEGDSYVDDNTLTVNITRLRKKLDDIGLVNYIITKKGIGYLVN